MMGFVFLFAWVAVAVLLTVFGDKWQNIYVQGFGIVMMLMTCTFDF